MNARKSCIKFVHGTWPALSLYRRPFSRCTRSSRRYRLLQLLGHITQPFKLTSEDKQVNILWNDAHLIYFYHLSRHQGTYISSHSCAWYFYSHIYFQRSERITLFKNEKMVNIVKKVQCSASTDVIVLSAGNKMMLVDFHVKPASFLAVVWKATMGKLIFSGKEKLSTTPVQSIPLTFNSSHDKEELKFASLSVFALGKIAQRNA